MFRYIQYLLVIVSFVFSHSSYAKEFFFPSGANIQQIADAIEFANNNDDEVSITVGSGVLLFDGSAELPPITGKVTLRSVFGLLSIQHLANDIDRPDAMTSAVFKIQSGGTLHLPGIEFSNRQFDRYPLIRNLGTLHLSNSLFKDINTSCLFFTSRAAFPLSCNPLIINSGDLTLSNVLFENISIFNGTAPSSLILTSTSGSVTLEQVILNNKNKPLFSAAELILPAFRQSGGSMKIINSTLTGTGIGLASNAESSTEIANSIIDFEDNNCDLEAQIHSLGSNISSDLTCDLSAAGDINGINPGFHSSLTRSIAQTGVAVSTPQLSAASPAIDSANVDFCPETDIFGTTRNVDGNNDGIPACDRGAVEFGNATLISGGANGMYFNPDADGHYLTIIETAYNTVVNWSTFDAQGNQAWIYAVGELINGRSMIAEAYINEGGAVLKNGSLQAAPSSPWGSLQIDLQSCDKGSLKYQSDRDEFGSGQFNFERLAVVKQLGCAD